MKKTLIGLMFFVLLAVGLPSKVFSFSLADDWSNAVNPNGTWSYNEGSNPLNLNIADWPLSEFGPSQTAWANGNTTTDIVPGWMKSVATPGGDFDWLTGDVITHSTDDFSGVGHGLANVTWTAPISGTFDINGGVWLGRDSLGRSNDWSLFLNGALLDSGNLFSGDAFSRAAPDTFSFLGFGITAGDVFKLQIAKTSEFGEFVGVNFTVTPEPLAITLFLIGGAPMAVNLYRKRRRLLKV